MLGARSGQGYGIILQRFQFFIIQYSIKVVGDICMHGQGREFYSCQARPQAKGRYMSIHGHGRVVLLMLGARLGQGYGIILQRFQFFIQYSIKVVGGYLLHAWPGKEFYSCQARPQAKGRYMSMHGHGRVVLLMLGARSGQGYGIILQRFQFYLQYSIKVVGDSMHGQGREFYSCQARPQAKGRDMSMPGHGRVVLLMLGARSGQGYGIILQRFQFYLQYSIKVVGDICMHGQEGSFIHVRRDLRPRVGI